MKKRHLAALLSLSLAASSAMAVTYTLGDVFNGISKVVSSATASSDGSSSSVSSSAPAGVLVKDLPDLPKLAENPFLRGLSKIDYAELDRNDGWQTQNNRLMTYAATNGSGCLRAMFDPGTKNNNVIRNFQNDAVNGKTFVRTNPITGFSNPYANDKKAFDLSSLNEATRADHGNIYTFRLKTHFKIPNEFVKNGKFVFEAETPGVMTYSQKIPGTRMNSEMVCYEMINGKILDDKKSTYSVKKGNIVDFQTTCYFGGTNEKDGKQSMISSINSFNEALPSSWTVYAVPDPLAKDSGKSYKLTNRDMFLYENEVYPAK
ncbi:MAG: hypothetical protein Q8R86_05555 [Sulfuricurvum sp.]|nr:hypothetical protein [Sulfuricurvum sp.]